MTARLTNPRHEEFAEGLAAGLSGTRAYARAYGRRPDATARNNASRLQADASISARVRALRDEGARAAEASLAVVIEKLQQQAVERIQAGDITQALHHVRALVRIADEL